MNDMSEAVCILIGMAMGAACMFFGVILGSHSDTTIHNYYPIARDDDDDDDDDCPYCGGPPSDHCDTPDTTNDGSPSRFPRCPEPSLN